MHALLKSAALACAGLAWSPPASGAETWWPANDVERIKRTGNWEWTSHRYAAESALVTVEEGAALEVAYRGHALVLGLDTLTPPNHYGPPELGALEIFVDGAKVRTVRPRVEDREVLLVRSPRDETHQVRIVHRREGGGAGCRIRGVRVVAAPSGDLGFVISGEHNGALVDVRAIVTHDGRVIRDTLVRNWLTGQVRLAALPPGKGYALELRAAGWRTWRGKNISVTSGEETPLPPVYLHREWDVPADDFKFPALGRPLVCRPGERFRARGTARGGQSATC